MANQGSRGQAMGGHQSAQAKSVIWLTPRFILDALGPFDLDPCAAPDPTLWPTAATHYVWPAQDGLSTPWFGRCWVNSPYGPALGRWLSRLADHGTGTALAFARTETADFFAGVWSRASALLFLEGRLYFHDQHGVRAPANSGAPSVLIAYGARDAEILLDCNLAGAAVALNRPTMIYLALRDEPTPHWRQIVSEVIQSLGGTAKLTDVYAALEAHPKTTRNANWKAKVRQTIARMKLPRIDHGTYTADLFART